MTARVGIPAARPGLAPYANGRPAGGRLYTWRDPARCSPARLAWLAAHDEYIAALGLAGDSPPPSAGPVAAAAVRDSQNHAKRALFNAARDAGRTVSAACRAAGVCRSTGSRWNQDRANQAKTTKEVVAQ